MLCVESIVNLHYFAESRRAFSKIALHVSELTKEELQAIFGEKRCKPEPYQDCSNTTFGCCADEFNAATGPFDEGCPPYLTCGDTRFGCCMDGATVASGLRFEGCPDSQCDKTL